MFPAWVTIVAATFAAHWVLREAAFERSTTRNGVLLFRPVMGARLIFWVGTPLSVLGFVAGIESGHVLSDWWIPAICLAFVPLFFLSPPGTILISREGISEVRWLGFRKVKIGWEEIESVVQDKADQTVTIFGLNGTKITHTKFNVDPLNFCAELKSHLKEQIITR